MKSKEYYVYLMTNPVNTVIYAGVTSNLVRRVYEHREKLVKGFTQKYNVDKLVYYEATEDVLSAIGREKQIKAGSRQKKLDLINAFNPKWQNLHSLII